MKLPGFKRFQSQDFPKKYDDLTTVLFQVLNPFMDVMTQALNKRLTAADNIDCTIVQLDVQAPVSNLQVKNPQGGIMRGCTVDYCINKNSPSDPLVSAPFVQFTTASDGQIVIENITGLTSGKTYTIRMIFVR